MATFTRFRSRAQRIQSERTAALAEQLQLCLGDPAIPQPALRAVLGAVRRQQSPAPNDRAAFVMITPQQNRAVVVWLLANSKRKALAVELWAYLFEHLDPDGSGRITLTRKQLAETAGAPPNHVSEVMSELVRCGAIIRQREENIGVVYYMNPFVGEFMRRRSREEMQQYPIPGLGLAVIDGDKT